MIDRITRRAAAVLALALLAAFPGLAEAPRTLAAIPAFKGAVREASLEAVMAQALAEEKGKYAERRVGRIYTAAAPVEEVLAWYAKALGASPERERNAARDPFFDGVAPGAASRVWFKAKAANLTFDPLGAGGGKGGGEELTAAQVAARKAEADRQAYLRSYLLKGRGENYASESWVAAKRAQYEAHRGKVDGTFIDEAELDWEAYEANGDLSSFVVDIIDISEVSAAAYAWRSEIVIKEATILDYRRIKAEEDKAGAAASLAMQGKVQAGKEPGAKELGFAPYPGAIFNDSVSNTKADGSFNYIWTSDDEAERIIAYYEKATGTPRSKQAGEVLGIRKSLATGTLVVTVMMNPGSFGPGKNAVLVALQPGAKAPAAAATPDMGVPAYPGATYLAQLSNVGTSTSSYCFTSGDEAAAVADFYAKATGGQKIGAGTTIMIQALLPPGAPKAMAMISAGPNTNPETFGKAKTVITIMINKMGQ